MAHKKYIKRGGKSFGPYYYENYRDKGKTKTRYIGKEHPEKNQKILRVNSKKYLLLVLGILILTSFLFYTSCERGLTSKTILEIGESDPELGLLGNFSLALEPNEFIPAETSLIIQNGNQTFEFVLEDLISESPYQGEFFVLRNTLSGIGLGFGSKMFYPKVFFELKLYNSSLQSSFTFGSLLTKSNSRSLH